MIVLHHTHALLSLCCFPLFYLREMIAGTLRISWDVFQRRPKLRPVFVRVPLRLRSRYQRLIFANLITMTPGTLSVDLSEDGSELLVHGLYAGDDPAGLVHSIQQRYLPVVARLPV